MAPALNSTSYVILGMLARCPMSGYDIKNFNDKSTRHFWAISYGQIYPELKNLADAGLIEPDETTEGPRPRTAYRLTPLGREALTDWVSDPRVRPQEVRDEMLLRLFFADVLPIEERRTLLESMVRRHRELARGLLDHEPMAAAAGPSMQLATLRFGIAFHNFCAEHFEALARSNYSEEDRQ